MEDDSNGHSKGKVALTLSPEALETIRTLQETLEPQLPAIRDIVVAMATVVGRLVELAIDGIVRVAEAVAPILEPLIQIGITGANCEKLERAGWLPHYTSPLEMLANGMPSTQEIDQAFHKHYADNWKTVRNAFEERLARYGVDADAKKTFQDALRLHEMGMYAAVSRHVFPEIERLARTLHLDGNRRDAKVLGLRKAAGQLILSQVEPGGLYGLALFRTLDGTVYDWADGKKELEHKGIPNRHSVMHAFQSFDTLQYSINSLIIMDYVLQVVHQTPASNTQETGSVKWMSENFRLPSLVANEYWKSENGEREIQQQDSYYKKSN